jgi:hypothetical protein
MRLEVFANTAIAAVRSIALGLKDLPAEHVSMIASFRMDTETQILEPHIGDTLSGKWRELPPEDQTRLTNFFAPFLDQFGYER